MMTINGFLISVTRLHKGKTVMIVRRHCFHLLREPGLALDFHWDLSLRETS
jgi:hypothetical protein